MNRRPVYRVYEDAVGEWRWRLVAANGRTVADSGEGYSRPRDAERAANTAALVSLQARVVVVR